MNDLNIKIKVELHQVQVDNTVADLRKLLDTKGTHESLLKDHITENLYKGHTITKCQDSETASVKEKFINALIRNIEHRYSLS